MEGKMDDPSLQNQEPSTKEKYSKEKIAVVNKDDSCRKKKEMEEFRLPASDPRSYTISSH